MSETIRDERGRIVAHIRDEGDTLRLRDAGYKTLGHYSKTRNITTDALYRPIGPGNQLLRLVPRR